MIRFWTLELVDAILLESNPDVRAATTKPAMHNQLYNPSSSPILYLYPKPICLIASEFRVISMRESICFRPHYKARSGAGVCAPQTDVLNSDDEQEALAGLGLMLIAT